MSTVYTAVLLLSDQALVFAGSSKEILETKVVNHANALPRGEEPELSGIDAAIEHIENFYGTDREFLLEEHP